MKLFLIGGFLGSGKTTAIQQAGTSLLNHGRKVAVITNDQGSDLVDTGYMESFGIATREVPNGCFCCNYEQLVRSVSSLVETEKPELIFAESVGSCTDLVATIAKPMAKFQPRIEIVISVFADAALLYSLVNGTSSFINDAVRYIFKKQLQEADILIINKIDLLNETGLNAVRRLIDIDCPGKTVLYQDSLEQQDVQQWLAAMENFSLTNNRTTLELDYDIYAAGEAMMGWLDESLDIFTVEPFAYDAALLLIWKIENEIRGKGYFIGHLKFLIDDGITNNKISFTAIPVSDNVQHEDYPATNKVSLLINVRVQADASVIKQVVSLAIDETVEQTGCQVVEHKLSSFQPGYPTPTYRFQD